MTYKRKTRDYWEIQGNYGYGWNTECCADTLADARQTMAEYQDNMSQAYHAQFRLQKRREYIPENT